MAVPEQKPGKSKQTYATPWAFIRAVERRTGVRFTLDLAANGENHKCERWLGPGGIAPDALEVSWARFIGDGAGWLNCPYGDGKVWARKSAEEVRAGARFVSLVTAAVDTDWFREYAWEQQCGCVAVNGRITFVGEANGHPKGSMLLLYGLGIRGFDVWAFPPDERRDPPA